MRKFLLTILSGIFISCSLHASPGEGMWLPVLLKQQNEKDMQAMGLRLTADDIYNINKSSLKDAVVSLGGFCTAEIVSREGLLFTNHHCGYDAIVEHSTVEHDYLKNGFWAKTREEELPNMGLTASILIYMKDVTQEILPRLKDVRSEEERDEKIRVLRDSIIKAEANPENYDLHIRSFFHGNEFYLLAYEVFKDVRLVGGPPAAIGKFGGDQDNWMWPRQTGDFSIFRIYTGKDGKPAAYNKENIPYKPKHYLTISLKGIKKNDYAMVMGYPGSTTRYLTSADFEEAADVQNPAIIEAMETELNIMKEDMDASRNTALLLASEYAENSNTYKYYQGQERQLKQMNYIEMEKQKEEKFTAWVNEKDERKKLYGNILSNIRSANKKVNAIEPGLSYVAYGLFNTSAVGYGISYVSLYRTLSSENPVRRARADSMAAILRPKTEEYFTKKNLSTDRKILTAELTLLNDRLTGIKAPLFLLKIVAGKPDAHKAITDYINNVYKKSILLNAEKASAFLKKPSESKLDKDPFFTLTQNIINYYYSDLSSVYNDVQDELDSNYRIYIQALREWEKDKKFYPDANSTLRLSYGKVLPYYPRDGVFYKYYTTYEGILEKNDPKDPEFAAPQRELDLFRTKQFGRYAENDTLRINFITDNDISGGNSGSPVMDGNGRLIGLAFDGDWESMIGDLYVDPALNRTIAVDIRYVLWVIDVYAGAQNIMKELTIEQ